MNVEGPPLLTSTKGMALECNMGHYEAEPHRLQLENDYAYYRWDRNHSTDTQVVWTSQGWNRRYRGWSSRQITRSHPCCRQENGSMHIPPMETSFGHWNMSLLLQDENPIIGRIFCWKSQHSVL